KRAAPDSVDDNAGARSDTESNDDSGTPSVVREEVWSGRPLKDHELPGRESVRVGAKYSPWTVPGYGGGRFRQRFAQVIQLDWRDARNQLIPPWNAWDDLRPGTLVMATVVFNVYVMPAKDPSMPKRKIYQALVKSLRVLGRSDIPTTKPLRSCETDTGGSSSRSIEDDVALQALSAISLPDETSPSNDASPSTTISEDTVRSTQDSVHEEQVEKRAGGMSEEGGQDENMVFLEDIEPSFVVNTRKSKKVKRG
ncbi:hypothetical protein AAF712_012844, partial [Marasmius tenuissimus]